MEGRGGGKCQRLNVVRRWGVEVEGGGLTTVVIFSSLCLENLIIKQEYIS